jgi:ribokinase
MDQTQDGAPDRPQGNPSGSRIVAGLGQCALDYLCTIDRYPPPNTKCEFREFVAQGGGPVATALVVLSRWGIAARFAGVVCGDPFGRIILEGLRQERIDTSAVLVRGGGRSQFAFICVERQTGNRTIFWGRPEASPFRAAEIPKGFLLDAAALHLDGLFLEASLHLAREARRCGIPVILDAGSLRPGMLELIRYTDHLIAAEEFIRQYEPEAPLACRMRKLRALGPEVVTVTLGECGSVSLWEDAPAWLDALQVNAVDTTGAGDVFHGAYIYGLLKGWSVPERIRWATVAAGLSCRSLGGRSCIPSIREVGERLSETGPFRNSHETADSRTYKPRTGGEEPWRSQE